MASLLQILVISFPWIRRIISLPSKIGHRDICIYFLDLYMNWQNELHKKRQHIQHISNMVGAVSRQTLAWKLVYCVILVRRTMDALFRKVLAFCHSFKNVQVVGNSNTHIHTKTHIQNYSYLMNNTKTIAKLHPEFLEVYICTNTWQIKSRMQINRLEINNKEKNIWKIDAF